MNALPSVRRRHDASGGCLSEWREVYSTIANGCSRRSLRQEELNGEQAVDKPMIDG